jgi:hypothetical protein
VSEVERTPAEWAAELGVTDPSKWRDDNRYTKDHFLFLASVVAGSSLQEKP